MSIHHTPAAHHEVARTQIRQPQTRTGARDHREDRPAGRPGVRFEGGPVRDREDRPAARPAVRFEGGPVRDRDDRPAARPAVRFDGGPVRDRDGDRARDRDRDGDRDRERPILQRGVYYRQPVERSVYVEPASYWSPSSAYTVAPQPIELMAPTSLASDQLSVDVNLDGATSLELDAASGTTFVSQVVLVDAYGGSQAIPVNQVLSASNPTLQLPLAGGSSIVRVIVDGHSDWSGQLAMRAL